MTDQEREQPMTNEVSKFLERQVILYQTKIDKHQVYAKEIENSNPDFAELITTDWIPNAQYQLDMYKSLQKLQ